MSSIPEEKTLPDHPVEAIRPPAPPAATTPDSAPHSLAGQFAFLSGRYQALADKCRALQSDLDNRTAEAARLGAALAALEERHRDLSGRHDALEEACRQAGDLYQQYRGLYDELKRQQQHSQAAQAPQPAPASAARTAATAHVRAGLARRVRFRLSRMAGLLRRPGDIGRRISLWRSARALARSGLFDADWYLEHYPDIAAAGWDPLTHYLEVGAAEGRDPNPVFQTAWYRDQYADLRSGTVNPLLHYLFHGAREGRLASPDFDTSWYVDQHPDIGGQNPLTHFLRLGRAAGVPTNALGSEPFAGIGDIDEPLGGDACQRLGRAVEVAADMVARGWAANNDYEDMRTAIGERRRARIARLTLPAPDIIDLAEGTPVGIAGRIALPEVTDPVVSVIIPVFNEIRTTLECLTSIARVGQGAVPFEIIVADDASTDETSEALAAIAHLTVVRNPENLNFLRNCNNAQTSARGRYLLFLNNDVQVTEGWLDRLVDTFSSAADVGAVAPKILYPNGRLQEAGAALNRDGSATLIGCGDDPSDPRFNRVREVDYCSGACLLVETARFREVGGFSDDLAPAYYEDADLCLKLRRLGLKILVNPASVIIHHLSKTTAGTDSAFKTRCITTNRQKILDRWQTEIETLNDVRVLAFYLPQYHPFPENDLWWGKGFTEWRNVTKAKPNFVGHYQPRLPADLGFYDLRVPEVMDEQAEMARRYGIGGFCYYYYWFAGKRLLEAPIERMLATGRPDLPFCLCWANENWTRRWDGQEHEILIAQNYSPEDDRAVIHDLIRYFRAPNHIRINGRPLLLVYNVKGFPDFARTAETWRKICRDEGVGEIYLAMVESFFLGTGLPDPGDYNCDASVEFPPHGLVRPRRPSGILVNPDCQCVADDYRDAALRYVLRPQPGHTRFPGVTPSWDNTARRQDSGMWLENSSPGAFQAWLEAALRQVREQNFGDERIVFVNAWNEWAEGAYLEPDRRYGHANLEAVRNALDAWQLARPGDRS